MSKFVNDPTSQYIQRESTMEILTPEPQQLILGAEPERSIPQFRGPALAVEHCHRYLYASRFVAQKRVLDIACGDGYGAAFLSQQATRVVGIDGNEHSIEHAKRSHAGFPRAQFEVGEPEKLDVSADSFDVAVCFETIEYLSLEGQHNFMERLKRSLAPDGMAIVSCADRDALRQITDGREKVCGHELSAVEFYHFLKQYFKSVIVVGQKPITLSMIWSLHDWRDDRFKFHAREDLFTRPKNIEQFTDPLHLIAVCSDDPLSREIADTSHSIYVDIPQLQRLRESFSESPQLRAEIEQLQGDLAGMRKEYNNGTEVVQRLYAENLGLKQSITSLESDIDERERHLDEAAGMAAERDTGIENLQREREEMNMRLAQLVEQNQSIQASLQEKIALAEKAHAENERYDARVNELQLQVEDLGASLAARLGQYVQLEGTESQLQQEIAKRDALIDSLQNHAQKLQETDEKKTQAVGDIEKKLEAQMSMIHRLQQKVDEQGPLIANRDGERRELESQIADLQRRLDEQSAYAQMALEDAESVHVRAVELQEKHDQQSVLARNMFRENESLRARLADFENGADADSTFVTELTNERSSFIEQIHKLQQEKEEHAGHIRTIEEGFKQRLEHANSILLQHEEQKVAIRQMRNDMGKQVGAFDTFQKSQGDLQQRYNRSQIKVQELQSHIGMLEQKLGTISHNPAYKVLATMGLFPKKDA